MPLYEYRCRSCGTITTTHDYDEVPECTICSVRMKRRYSFFVERPFTPHYNISVGKFVNTQSEFNDALKIASEEATLRTGILHNYVASEVNDSAAFGMTEEYVEEAKAARYDHPAEPESVI